jgi:hypothetical protein
MMTYEELKAENDRLIHDIQAPDGYSWEWHCQRKDEEIERLRDLIRDLHSTSERPRGLLTDEQEQELLKRIREALGDE